MSARHPQANGPAREALVVGPVEHIPICGQVKSFHTWNETTVCTIETVDASRRRRGGIAIGFSKHGREDGVATYSTIAEAEALLALLGNAIADARRIEAGQPTHARPGREPPTVQ